MTGPSKFRRTNRGFAYKEYKDTRGCVVRVQRSSSAEQSCVWIFTDDPNHVYTDGKPAPHLNRTQARRVANALLAFANEEDYK